MGFIMKKEVVKNLILRILLMAVIINVITLLGCFSYNLRAESIAIDEATVPNEVTVDDLNLSDIKLLVTRVDGSIDSVSITKDMLTTDSLKKLKTIGYHNIYIRYDGKYAVLSINVVEKYSNVTITFESNGGTKVSPQTIEKNSKAFRPINPSKKGYIFGGWYLDKALTEEFLFSTIIHESLVLYARWEKATNTITYVTNAPISIPNSIVKTGEKLYEIIPKRDGYAFDGWYLDEKLINKYDYNTIVDSSFTLYAKWEANKHTITFKCNGGSSIASINVLHDEKLSGDFATVRKGYKLVGWYIDKELTTEYDFNTPVTEDFTLYAKWEKAILTVRFECNGGSEINDIFVVYGDIIREEFSTTKDNAIFLGWYLDKDFLHEYNRRDEITEDITLYAKWQMNDVTITFESNGGSKIESQKIKYGNKVNIPEKPSKLGYIFVGWCTNKSLDQEFDFDTPVYEDITIYAKWILDTSTKNKYTVIIFNEEMVVLDSFKVEEGSNLKDIIPLDIDLKIFAGWYSDQTMTTEYDLTAGIYSNTYIYAKYIDAYKIEYLDRDGNTILIETVGEGMNGNPPKAPDVKGYVFVGWDKDITNVRSNIVTKAVYTTYKYEVKFIIDGVVISTQKVDSGKWPQEPLDIDKYIKEGYHFKKWNHSLDAIYEDTTYVAEIEKNVYKVNFVDYFGNIFATKNVRHGELIEKPRSLFNDYYVVSNWFVDNTFKTGFDFSKGITNDTNVYGYFDFNERITYTIEDGKIIINNFDLLNIKEVIIPENLNDKKVVSIKNFTNYETITKIIISNNLVELKYDAFNKFTNLKEINVLEENIIYSSLDGVLYDKEAKTLLVYPTSKKNEMFKVPNSVITVSDNAFSFSKKLMKIDLSNILSIGKNAFSDSSIISLIINKDGIEKNDETFNNCNESLKIIVNEDFYLNYINKWSDIQNIIYSTKNVYNQFLYQVVNGKIEIIEYLGSEKYLEIPSMIDGIEVTSIKGFAFNSNFDLKGLHLPNTIVNIENNAFYNIELEYLIIESDLSVSTEYLKKMAELFSQTNIYVKDELYDKYKTYFGRCYMISQIDGEYSYIYDNGLWGILQYFGNEKEVTFPISYGQYDISFIDKNFIISSDTISIRIDAKLDIRTNSINKNIYFLVNEKYLEYYSQYDYAFYSNEMIISSDLYFIYGILNNEITIIKIGSKFEEIIIPDLLDGKKVVAIGRFSLIENGVIKRIEIGKNVSYIGKNGLKTTCENGLKIVFNSNIAPQIEEIIAYDSDVICRKDYTQKEYGIRFSNNKIEFLDAEMKENDEYQYYILNDKIIIIKCLINEKEISIPRMIDGYEVVAIEPFAFSGKVVINKVIVPETVASIGYLAFDNMRNLSEIIIEGNKVVYIEDQIVRKPIIIRVNDSMLYRYRNSKTWEKQEVFSKSSTVIRDDEFRYVLENNEAIIIEILKYDYNYMFSNYIGDNRIKRLGAYSFNDTDIERIYILRQIDEIGYCALPKTLESLSLAYSLPPKMDYQEANFEVKVSDEYMKEFKNNVLWKKYQLASITAEKGSNDLFEYLAKGNGITITKYLGNDLNVVIPEEINGLKVVSIGEKAFMNTNIISVTLPDSITDVSDYAFYNCGNLESIQFSSSIISIGARAFDKTKWLRENYNEYMIIGQVLYKYNDKFVLESKAIVPNGIVSIAPYAFENAISVSEVILPATITKIGIGAFSGCSNLLSIEIPKLVERIEEGTFENCTRLKKIIFNENLFSIGSKAFLNCIMLSEVSFSNLEEIEENAFEGCKNLTSVYLPSTIKKIGNNVFKDCIVLYNINIDSKAQYKVVDGVLYSQDLSVLYEDLLKSQKRVIEISASTTLIKEKAFYGSMVTKVIISSKVTMENNVFGNNDYLNGVVFTTSKLPIITETSFEKGMYIYFPNSVIDSVHQDYIYDEYKVNSILSLSSETYTIKVGEKVRLTPIAMIDYNDGDIHYLSSDNDVLTVEDGVLIGQKAGKVTLTISLVKEEAYVVVITINVEK